VESLRSAFYNRPFDIKAHDRQYTLLRYSTFLVRYLQSAGGGFVIRFLKVSFSIKLAVFLARGDAHMKTH
jgi:hypothetical protein